MKNFIDDAIGEHSDRLFLQMKRKPLMVDPYPKTKLRKRHRSLGLSANQKKELGIGALHKDKQRLVKSSVYNPPVIFRMFLNCTFEIKLHATFR